LDFSELWREIGNKVFRLQLVTRCFVVAQLWGPEAKDRFTRKAFWEQHPYFLAHGLIISGTCKRNINGPRTKILSGPRPPETGSLGPPKERSTYHEQGFMCPRFQLVSRIL